MLTPTTATFLALAVITTVFAASGAPTPKGKKVLSSPQRVTSSFDGGMMQYDTTGGCTSGEGQDKDAVFILSHGASLSNVIIGPNQKEGVHCYGSCNLHNVWWLQVCEDAFSIKEQSEGETTTVTGGGAFKAKNKVFQHDAGGTLKVSGFTVSDSAKLYASCGAGCDGSKRVFIGSDITATNVVELVAIEASDGDTCVLTGIKASGVGKLCTEYSGNSPSGKNTGACRGEGASGSTSGNTGGSSKKGQSEESKKDSGEDNKKSSKKSSKKSGKGHDGDNDEYDADDDDDNDYDHDGDKKKARRSLSIPFQRYARAARRARVARRGF